MKKVKKSWFRERTTKVKKDQDQPPPLYRADCLALLQAIPLEKINLNSELPSVACSGYTQKFLFQIPKPEFQN